MMCRLFLLSREFTKGAQVFGMYPARHVHNGNKSCENVLDLEADCS